MAFFTNRVALITGAGSGLGKQLALLLADEGAAVAGLDLKPEPLAALASELAGKPFASAVADVTDRLTLAKAVAQVRGQLGPVDLLIANAGIGIENSARAFRAEDFEAQIRVNLIGVANSVEAVLPSMIERRHGHLVGISSLASYRGLPKMLGYCASKSGLNALLEGLRVELKPLGISVTAVCPGWIRTPMTANVAVPASEMMELPNAARRIVSAIRQGRPFYAFPSRLARRARLLHWLPSGLSDWLVRQAHPGGADS
ncbi:MAG TPA: SDR family NAD(P)-dependent oxidoreductase [Gemmataceae bacterium]|nr:SDR family NAD(P)-dependent oxidoreductase [Gemmataceae bacterium]